MKCNNFLILLMILVISQFLQADVELNSSMTLIQISETTEIPVRKLIEYLDLDIDTNTHTPIRDFDRSSNDIKKAKEKYSESKKRYFLGIVIVGMGTVFASLILVSLIIAQLRHLDKKKTPKPRVLAKPEAIGLETTDEGDIAAALITTIYLHELEVEENNKLLLTWKRAPLSMWRASNYIPMNEVDPSRRKQ